VAEIIRAHDNNNLPIIDGTGLLGLTYFNVLRLHAEEETTLAVPGFETVYVVLSGNCDIQAGNKTFKNIGQRKDLWSGKADSVYTGLAPAAVRANVDDTEIAVAGGRCEAPFDPFRISPEEVDLVEVGSNETKTRRRIYHILGHNAAGRAGNLLVSELYADEGCWSGYPPHKHDEAQGAEETPFEEAYYYRFRPETGFGAQIVFYPNGAPEAFMTRNGDTILLDRGYHPTVTSPGHDEYIFTILVGKEGRSLVQFFHEDHRHLMDRFPGVAKMREKFRQP